MNELSKKILESGLVDRATAKMLERWGVIDETASELVKEDNLKRATREQLMEFADELEEHIEKRRSLRESMLDLDRLRWPAPIKLRPTVGKSLPFDYTIRVFQAVIDRMGRYYLRPQDVKKEWFVPGYTIERTDGDAKKETILEVTEIMVGDGVAAIQVSTTKE